MRRQAGPAPLGTDPPAAQPPADLAALKALLARADVAIQNFRPGVAERLGLSFEALKAINFGALVVTAVLLVLLLVRLGVRFRLALAAPVVTDSSSGGGTRVRAGTFM